MSKTTTRVILWSCFWVLLNNVSIAQSQQENKPDHPLNLRLYKSLIRKDLYKVWVEGGLTYQWNTGATTKSVEVNLYEIAGINVEVEDAIGTTWQLSYGSGVQRKENFTNNLKTELRQVLAPCGLGWGYQNSTCAGGTISLWVGTGTETGYSYSWSTGATTRSITVTPNTNGTSVYSVTVTKGSCQDIYTSNPIQIITPNYSISDITASNQLDCTPGNMTLTIVATKPANVTLQYSLDGVNWQSSNQFTNRSIGNYTAYVRETTNCIVTFQKLVEEFEPINLQQPTLSNLGDCTLGNVGVAVVVTGGKIDGYRYRLNGGNWSTTPNFSGLGTGQYLLEAEPVYVSSGTCNRSLNFGVVETNGVSLTSLSLGQVNDCTLNNATITAQVNQPGGANVEYRLNAGAWQTNNQFTNLGSGTYTVDIRSTAGCPVATSTLTISITEQVYPKLQRIDPSNDRDCTNGNVQLQAVLENNSIPAQYRLNGGPWVSNPVFSNLASGSYTIEVCLSTQSSSFSGITAGVDCTCPSSKSITVQEISQVSITGATTYNIADCAQNNIMINVQHNAQSTTGLQFRLNGGAWQSSTWFKGLSSGSYTIEGRIQGDGICTATPLSYSLSVSELSGNTVVDTIILSNHTDCTVGNARIQVNLKQAVTAQYRMIIGNSTTDWQNSNVFTNRASGTYVIEVRPTNNACTERDTLKIDEKTVTIGTLVITGKDDCFQGNLKVIIPTTKTPLSQPLQYRLAGYSTPTAWQNDSIFSNFAGYNYNRVEVKTSSACVFSKTADFFEQESIAISITGLTYLSGKTDCTKGNTYVRINTAVTVEGTGATVTQWRVNGGAWTTNPDLGPYGRDSILVEVLAYDNTQNGCIISKKMLVDEKTPIDITALALSQDKDCTLSNAKISTQATGSNTPFQYKLGSGSFSTNAVFSNLGSGLYLVTAKDASNCQDTMSVRIIEPPLLQITGTTKANETDCTAGNAQVTVNTSGTRGSVTYKVNNGNPLFSNVIPNLGTGTYTISVLDGAGCTASTNISISEPAQLTLSLAKQQEHDCTPGNTRIVATAIGAQGTLSYKLDGGTAQSSNIFNFVPNGSHTVSVQDASSGCLVSNTIVIGEDAQLIATTAVQNVLCFGGNNGAVTILVSGGAMPYTFNWSNYGSTTNTIQNLPIGTYSVTVSDARACQVIKTVTVSQPGGIGYGANPAYKDITCYGGNDGSILLQPFTGGTAPYSFSWSNGATTSSLTNLSAGTYSLTVTDAVGCQKVVVSSTLGQPQPLAINSTSQYTNHLDCIANNTAITLSASGGRGGYTYRLNGGTAQTSGTFAGKTTGTYQILVKDTANCIKEFTISVTEKLPPPVISIDTVRVCAGASATVTISGAPGSGMQYSWTVPGGANNPGNVAQFNTLIAGTYNVTMTETATSCSRTASGVVVHKALPVANAGSTQIICVGSSATLSGTASGSISPYTYAWSNGATTSTTSVSPTVATTYTLTVTDSKGCVDTSQVTVVINSLPTASIQNNNGPICRGQTATFNVTGTTGAVLTYKINSGADQTLNLTGTTQTIQVANATESQTLTLVSVSTTGTSGCTNNLNLSSTVALNPVLVANAGSNKFTCPLIGTELNASASGGTAPYTYAWDNFGNYVNNAHIGVVLENTTTYTLTVTDSKGCKASSQVIVNVYPALITSAGANQTICRGQNVTLTGTAIGGTGIHTYAWNGGATTNSVTVNPIVSTTYTLTVTDLYGCTGTSSVSVTVNPKPIVQLKATDTLRCDQPEVALSPITAAEDLQLKWKNGQGTVLTTTRQIQVGSAGTYVLEVTDALGCKNSDTTQVITYIPQIAQIDSFPSTHCDSANAQIRIRPASPGAWLYRIDGTDWDTSATFSGLLMGTYAISIASPDTSCIIDTTITIGSREICIEICAGDSILIGKPGLNPWCMKWLPEDGLSNPDSSYTWVKPTNSTIYRLIITDDDGNILDSLIYNVTLCPQLSVSPSTLNLCEQNNPILSAVGGTGPYIWRNQHGAIVGEGQTYAPTEPGTYTVQQSNNLALAASANVSKLLGNQKLQIEPGLAAICGDSVRLSVAGNFHNFVWRDSNGQTLSQKSYAFIKQQGTYTLTAEAGEGCILDTQTTVFASGFALSIPAADVVISCNKTRNLPYPIVETRYGSGIDSLLVTAPEHYQFRAEWRKDCQSCGQVRLSIESDESIGGNTPCTKVIRRTWVARDECGRRASTTQIIRWQDNTAPAFVQFPESDTLMWGWPLPTETPIVSDDCDATPKLNRTVDSTVTETIKVVQIHWQARDTCGNTHTQTQIITYLKPAVEDSFNLSAKYACGDDFTPQTPSNQEPLSVLRPKTVIDAYGFAIQVTKIDGPEINATGVYSGEAVAMIPFTNKPARFRFSSLKINSSYEVLSGNLTSLSDPDSKLPKFETAQSKLDICLPPPPPPVGTNGENDSGFDADGKFVKQPPYEGYKPGDAFDPTRDPNGFDKDGIHVETGTIYNPQGCSAQGVDSTGQKCDPTGAGPYYWLNPNGLDGPPTGGGTRLANQVRDTLRPLVIKVLEELIRVNDSLILELKADCDELRGGTDAAYAATGMGDRDLVFGTDDQFFKEGLAKSFESRPKLLPETVQREAAHFDLQKKHVKLFECDESLAKLRALSTLLLSLQEDPGLSSLVREMIERLKRVSDADTASINSIAELIPWLSGQVSTYATNLNNFKFNRTGSIEATPATPHIKHARDWGEQISTFNAPTPDASQQAAALLAEYESGAEYIGGVHRAFYVREIARRHQTQWLTNDSLKVGASLFPIEIKTGSEGHKISFLIDNIQVSSSGAYADAYIILNMMGKEIAFRAENVPIDPAGLIEDGKMYLANDVEIRLSNTVMMIFKAGTTYVNWDCQGFDKVGVDLEFEFCEKFVVPVNPQTQQVDTSGARVKGRATAVIKDLNDFTVAINITPFALTNYPEVQINVQNAIADFSDTETPEEIKFPTGYTFPEGNYERWRGVYLGQVSVTLPISLAENGLNLAIGAENFIIDDQGVSGSAFAANIVSLSKGNFSGFAASVDTVRVDFLANHFVGAGLVGNIHLPLFGKPEGAIGPEDCFRYRGRMEPKQGFKFAVLPREDMTMDLLKAKATILASSSIEMQYVGGRFKVRATLNGSIAIDNVGTFPTEKEKPVASGSPPPDTMPQKQTKLGLALPPITFEKLVLSNEAPYLSPGIWTMPASASARLGKFKLGIDALKMVAREGNQAGLYVETRVELSDDEKVPAKGAFEIYGELKIENGRQRWVGKGLRIKKFNVNADIKGNTIKGTVFHFDGDSTSVFGSGFRGTLSVKFAKLGNAGIDALAQFGEVDGFKYFMVDVMATLPGAGIPLGPMYIKKLGGGLSNRMTRTDDVSFPTNWASSSGSGGSAGELGTSLSGVQYYPSSDRGLGLRLALMMTAEKEESFSATVSLEAIFNSKASGGGIHELALDGFIQFMTKPKPEMVPVKSGSNGLDDPKNSIPNASKVAGFMSIKYNFDKGIFDANFRVFFNADNLRGSGDARFYFSPAKWFINIGEPEPSKRINLTMDVPGLPNNALLMTAYLNIGNGIPAMPPLPAHIRELTGLGATQGAESTRGSGNGFAFGADLSITTGELKFLKIGRAHV